MLTIEAAVFHATSDRWIESAAAIVRQRERELYGLKQRLAHLHRRAGGSRQETHFAARVEATATLLDVTKPAHRPLDDRDALSALRRGRVVPDDLKRHDGAHQRRAV